MYQVGLLLLTGSIRMVVDSIAQYLKYANKNIIERLYVKLEPELSKPVTKSEVSYLRQLSDSVPILYNKASVHSKHLDVRLLLSDAKKQRKFDVILTNSAEQNCNIFNYLDQQLLSNCDNIIKLHENDATKCESTTKRTDLEFSVYRTVCLGGTFDRLHNGHKVLLSEAILRAMYKLIVGVTDGPMLRKKILWELIEPVEKRMTDVRDFLFDVDPSLLYKVDPITDPYGPTITQADIDCIIVSAETKKGGERVNEKRNDLGMKELEMHVVNLVENMEKIPGEEDKLSSSTGRMHLLGTCLKSPKATLNQLYVILLQGLPLTGKSHIAECFKKLGTVVFCCNEIILSILNGNKILKEKICRKFDNNLLGIDGTVDQKSLTSWCLKDNEKRRWIADNLTEMVEEEIRHRLKSHHQEGAKLILIQDSLLLDGSINFSEINELWSTILPPNEIAKRLNTCYEIPEDEAINVVSSLPSNENYIEKCNRIFCTQWTTDITDQQVSRAWSELQVKIM